MGLALELILKQSVFAKPAYHGHRTVSAAETLSRANSRLA